jgi:arylformamidase
MQTYDISVTIGPEMITWPGQPKVELERLEKIEDGSNSNVSKLIMSVHSGTHVDAPSHFLKDGKSIEELALKTLTGRAYVLDLPYVDTITAEVLEKADIPPRTRRLLFKTRNSSYWVRARQYISGGLCRNKR